ncbi:MAG: 50S ribosomal protein L19, partial [Planctomycetota bacterium]
MTRIHLIEQGFAKKELPDFGVGDTVDVHVLIKEGDKERVQVYSGTVLRRRGVG